MNSRTAKPLHVAIIMDGNRRWAQAKGLPGFAGHRAGVEALKQTVECCANRQIKYLTVYVFSTENWARQKEEVEFLFNLLDKVLAQDLKSLKEKGVRLRFIGDMSSLNGELRFKLQQAELQTQDNNTLNLQIAINYGGRREIVQAVQSLSSKVASGQLQPEQIDDKVFSEHLYTREIPDPDLLIRTGGENRISNYLLWQIAYAEIIVLPTLWPDFAEDDLDRCLEEFNQRSRRFGR